MSSTTLLLFIALTLAIAHIVGLYVLWRRDHSFTPNCSFCRHSGDPGGPKRIAGCAKNKLRSVLRKIAD